jgi:hypothetical protein
MFKILKKIANFLAVRNWELFCHVSQSIASIGTLILIVYGLFFSPLSERKEVEYKQEIQKTKDDLEHLTTKKNEAELELQKLKSEVDLIEAVKIENQQYLKNLYQIVRARFLQNVDSRLKSLSETHEKTKFLPEIIANQDRRKNQKSFKNLASHCWTQDCVNDVSKKISQEIHEENEKLPREVLIFELGEYSEQEIEHRKSILTQSDWSKQDYNLFHILNTQLEGDEFTLLMPQERSELKSKIRTFMNQNRKTLSLPLLTKLPRGWDMEMVKKEREKIDQNYSKINELVAELAISLN